MSKKKNLLIFPAGTEIAFEIHNALKFSKFVNIFGGTSADDHSEFVYERLIKGFPYIGEDNFIEYLNKVIEEYKIEYIYPAHDSACVYLSKHSKSINAVIVCSEYDTVAICRSKSKTYSFFKGEEFIPITYKTPEQVQEFPVFVKPTVGQGAVGAEKIDNMEQLKFALEKDESLVICEYLSGVEYSVDCFTDKDGNLRVARLRDRERIRAGISVRSKVLDSDNKIVQIANALNSKLKFRGAWFFQVKKNYNGEYRLMEVSPRIPGTMGLSRNLGINFPLITLFDMWGFDVDIIDNNYDIILDRAFYSAYKIDINYNKIYVDYDDTLVINDSVNIQLLAFIYQAYQRGKKIYILSKHIGDIYEDMKKRCISIELFEKIIVIDENDEKSNYISTEDSIFIDDSYAERIKIKNQIGIPVFDVDMVESLIDWRK